jgi:hypothetical protein
VNHAHCRKRQCVLCCVTQASAARCPAGATDRAALRVQVRAAAIAAASAMLCVLRGEGGGLHSDAVAAAVAALGRAATGERDPALRAAARAALDSR